MNRHSYESPAHKRFAAKLARQLDLELVALEQALGVHPQMLDDLLRVRTELRVLLHKIRAAAKVEPAPQPRKTAVRLHAASREPAATGRPRLPISKEQCKKISGNSHDSQVCFF